MKDKRVLPDSKTMMEAVYAVTSSVALTELLTTDTPKNDTTKNDTTKKQEASR